MRKKELLMEVRVLTSISDTFLSDTDDVLSVEEEIYIIYSITLIVKVDRIQESGNRHTATLFSGVVANPEITGCKKNRRKNILHRVISVIKIIIDL